MRKSKLLCKIIGHKIKGEIIERHYESADSFQHYFRIKQTCKRCEMFRIGLVSKLFRDLEQDWT